MGGNPFADTYPSRDHRRRRNGRLRRRTHKVALEQLHSTYSEYLLTKNTESTETTFSEVDCPLSSSSSNHFSSFFPVYLEPSYSRVSKIIHLKKLWEISVYADWPETRKGHELPFSLLLKCCFEIEIWQLMMPHVAAVILFCWFLPFHAESRSNWSFTFSVVLFYTRNVSRYNSISLYFTRLCN